MDEKKSELEMRCESAALRALIAAYEKEAGELRRSIGSARADLTKLEEQCPHPGVERVGGYVVPGQSCAICGFEMLYVGD
ncbi:MAG: hypothetical protein Q7S96_04820 [bacterium]|nr:hypothetical protein [bacterium]